MWADLDCDLTGADLLCLAIMDVLCEVCVGVDGEKMGDGSGFIYWPVVCRTNSFASISHLVAGDTGRFCGHPDIRIWQGDTRF